MSGDCFSKLPLYGKIFYLDTPSYKHNKQLQSRLKRLGAIQTRAYKMMSKITINPKESTVQKARRLKLNVQPLNKVLCWLLDIEKAQNKSRSKPFDVASKRHKSSSLKGFFIKVEDLSRNFRPIYKQFLSKPEVNYNALLHESPFQKNGTRSACIKITSNDNWSSFLNKRTKLSSEKRNGYCEICDVYFSNCRQHLNGDTHKKNTTPKKYKRLDSIIANCSQEMFLCCLNNSAQPMNSNASNKLRDCVVKIYGVVVPGPYCGQLRRSQRLIAKQMGSMYLDCPGVLKLTN
ncbi:protein DBF4 homolog B isoform X3 [Hydra vulgaris]|uniref:Protein DBF4 homolog B isoform X3 n=1 Tax=Hydra vulgaris TaxID=6087 RepID=A0ABM4BGM9_HYDVU